MSESAKTVHVISHSHWDREWYMPYEKHHVRLIELMDTLLGLMEADPEFRSFHLDGQTIILEDYLQVRPEMRGRLEHFVRNGQIQIGPWYILQDEFLTSSEANIRNLLIGLQDASAYDKVSKLGYFPDSFGNMGQAPQILRQAGIDTAVFGRGVKPTGFNNEISGSYSSMFSEMYWESPDGSKVLGILFANWYHNGMEIPTDPKQAALYWKTKLQDAEQFASTPHLLFMNGCDHQPVQTDLSAALNTAREILPEITFVHSNFDDYIASVKAALPEDLAVIHGELRSQQTNGWFTLANTASARVYIKQENQRGQTMLEKVAEPLAAFAALAGKPYPHHLFTYAWKTLMQNHPHDSICGCSVDEVHREMMTRFAKSFRVAEEIALESMTAITSSIDTESVYEGQDAVPFVLFNSTGWKRTGVVVTDVDIQRLPIGSQDRESLISKLKQINPGDYTVVDPKGQAVPAAIEDLGVTFGYDLPKDKFRQPYMARTVRVTFHADAVPPLGYRTYALVRQAEVEASTGSNAADQAHDSREMENEFLAVRIQNDGTLHVTDKRNGRVYQDLGAFDNTGDIGNEYIYKQPEGEQTLTTFGHPAVISLHEKTDFHTSYDIIHEWEIPAGADERLVEEIAGFVPFLERQAQRSEETVTLRLNTRVTLEQGNPFVRFNTRFNNQAMDHRLRVLFPSDVEASVLRADSIFEVAQRDIQPSVEWVNPSNAQHQQAFVNVSDEEGGVTVANLGLNEYEVLRDGRNTIAVTLLRAVGELGDWGVFPTPEAQCIGEQSCEYLFIPHEGGDGRMESFAMAYQEQVPWMSVQTAMQPGALPAEYQFVEWSGANLALSTVKIAKSTGDLILRWFNTTNESAELSWSSSSEVRWYKSNVIEEPGELLPEGSCKLSIGRAEIVTVGGVSKDE
ncbi:alpha-mannosidase [Paenibacillus nasutitermitis]|uniref:Glycosyl hydrolase n=1 Tax=Paenibacillus nasutitermitis TaxID=1652958 RepID=A0A916YKK2_9BACL|nr:alpha-mannosidase [Paenibacillus nasutitermitis]GGD49464.1 glycosyl hydrolase [Paenibacillus nasutitermitis]